VGAFIGAEELQGGGDQRAGLFKCARTRGAEERLQFGEGQFNRVEVWTVRRQESEERSSRLNCATHLRLLVRREVVEHDDVAWMERGHEDLLDIGPEGDGIDGAIEDGCRRQRRGPKRGDNGVGLPMAARCVIANARAARAAGIAANQFRRDARFIDEDVPARIVERQRLIPMTPRGRDIRPTLFIGVDGFF